MLVSKKYLKFILLFISVCHLTNHQVNLMSRLPASSQKEDAEVDADAEGVADAEVVLLLPQLSLQSDGEQVTSRMLFLLPPGFSRNAPLVCSLHFLLVIPDLMSFSTHLWMLLSSSFWYSIPMKKLLRTRRKGDTGIG